MELLRRREVGSACVYGGMFTVPGGPGTHENTTTSTRCKYTINTPCYRFCFIFIYLYACVFSCLLLVYDHGTLHLPRKKNQYERTLAVLEVE